MGNEAKQHRFQELRQREAEDSLTEAEQAELDSLVEELEVAEAAYLAPATQRLRQARETIEAQNRRLESLARRKEGLISPDSPPAPGGL